MSEAVQLVPRNRKPRFRAARRKALRDRGIQTTNKRRIWHVTPTVLKRIPEWIQNQRVSGLAGLWLRCRAAQVLISLDKAAGGHPMVTVAVFRYCDLCGRPLVGAEANARIAQIEASPTGRSLPCGPTCEQDRISKLWKRLRTS